MNERKICVSSRKFCTKDNNKTAHWVGRATLKTLGTDGFFQKKRVVDDVQDISTGTKFEHSASGKQIPDLIQEDE